MRSGTPMQLRYLADENCFTAVDPRPARSQPSLLIAVGLALEHDFHLEIRCIAILSRELNYSRGVQKLLNVLRQDAAESFSQRRGQDLAYSCTRSQHRPRFYGLGHSKQFAQDNP